MFIKYINICTNCHVSHCKPIWLSTRSTASSPSYRKYRCRRSAANLAAIGQRRLAAYWRRVSFSRSLSSELGEFIQCVWLFAEDIFQFFVREDRTVRSNLFAQHHPLNSVRQPNTHLVSEPSPPSGAGAFCSYSQLPPSIKPVRTQVPVEFALSIGHVVCCLRHRMVDKSIVPAPSKLILCLVHLDIDAFLSLRNARFFPGSVGSHLGVGGCVDAYSIC